MAAASTYHPVIVFDGVCLLCNRWLGFVLRRDHAARFRFASMQSHTGSALLARHGLDPQDPSSFLLVEGSGIRTNTAAIIAVLWHLGLAWRVMAGLLWLLPRPLRDWGYRRVARNRYRWFGRHDVCPLPPAQWRDRVITD